MSSTMHQEGQNLEALKLSLIQILGPESLVIYLEFTLLSLEFDLT